MLCYLAFCEYVLHLLCPMRKTPYASSDCGEYASGFCFDTTLLNVHGVTIFTLSHRFLGFTRAFWETHVRFYLAHVRYLLAECVVVYTT